MTFTVLVTAPGLASEGRTLLERAGCRLLFVEGGQTDVERLLACEPIDAVISRTIRIEAEAIYSCPTLRIIAKHGVGVSNIDVEAASRRRIPVCFTPNTNTRAVAELTLGLIFAVARDICGRDREMRSGKWSRPDTGRQIAGLTLGLVGVGAIGSMVAGLGASLGMRVLGYDPAPIKTPAVTPVPLRELLRASDVVSLHCPATRETLGLIGEPELALMKTDAVLINTARGELVDEAALVSALESGHLHGAGLDSFTIEPLPPASPLRWLPNVVLSPHLGASTGEALQSMARGASLAVLEWLHHRKLDFAACANPQILAQIQTAE